ncbi:hypothetical protein GCM10010174_44690 [Kutzneria viridogrisea]|uniref:Uncharacterized protein n=2 Tax=Kutzneria TaxID=43356 RepID=W5WGX8_9PSEU|nr:hypothetical protein [Kutzneria albida]AHH99841.1 hypothetical protein KALB_6482 [Kutzneria albida DSM 43870]MBA8925017.1 hypothetical protein [Kutzneria viridogrisea]
MGVINAFAERFRQVLAESGRATHVSPTELLDRWDGFVVLCEEGYEDNIYEYNNDLSVRDAIDSVLRDGRLREFDQWQWFKEQVDAIDARFRAVTYPEPVRGGADWPWWRAHVPARAGSELAADLHSRYGVVVSVV